MSNNNKNNTEFFDHTKYGAWKLIKESKPAKIFASLLIISFFFLVITLFLPWTQNVRTRGYVTTISPDQRPQNINSIIGGRIEKWYVREGDFVAKGDTIMMISEVKDEYFDPQLLQRTQQQIQSKVLSVSSYAEKIKSIDAQISALQQTQQLKLEQAENYIVQAKLKVQSDSIDFEASKLNYQIAIDQFTRMEKLYKDGLKSLTDLESRKQKQQETQAKRLSAQNKLLSSKNEFINARVEFESVKNQYLDKLSKAESEKYEAMSALYDAEATVSKMQNQYSNYIVRQGMYIITSPQDAYITKTVKNGIGETVKEGEVLLSIMPSTYKLAVEMYVLPQDMPLIHIENKVRMAYDGWPAIVFSGWPNVSYGTFGGKIVAIDNFISKNGMYRVMVAQDPDDVPWPVELRVGSGASCIALFKDVKIGYEIWRNMNGFPPDYYKSINQSESNNKE